MSLRFTIFLLCIESQNLLQMRLSSNEAEEKHYILASVRYLAVTCWFPKHTHNSCKTFPPTFWRFIRHHLPLTTHKTKSWLPVIGAWGLDHLMRIDVSPTSSIACWAGVSGAGEKGGNIGFFFYLKDLFQKKDRARKSRETQAPTRVVKVKVSCFYRN